MLNKLIPAALALLFATQTAQAFEPTTAKVTDKVYAIIGELDQRTAENQGLNNTTGFIITDDGVVLVGSGATEGSAKMLEAAIKTVTDKPIKQVLNIGVSRPSLDGQQLFSGTKNSGQCVSQNCGKSENTRTHEPDAPL